MCSRKTTDITLLGDTVGKISEILDLQTAEFLFWMKFQINGICLHISVCVQPMVNILILYKG
jgi:hypothetical protein